MQVSVYPRLRRNLLLPETILTGIDARIGMANKELMQSTVLGVPSYPR